MLERLVSRIVFPNGLITSDQLFSVKYRPEAKGGSRCLFVLSLRNDTRNVIRASVVGSPAFLQRRPQVSNQRRSRTERKASRQVAQG